ncbi:DUF397 domain-containing protein [Actinokineospora soli]|uniref:DUF397 domain-containing protein n=1 Tax=Actinokineospora soli TaxID=1048753 RepID=A0ABW2TJ70_9PSEU
MEWRKSSRSGNQSDCVELRRDLSAVRDSKNPDTALTFPRPPCGT